MRLAGQDRKREGGYALAVLLVAIAVMSILLTEAMPVWHQEVQREKEAELIFRGEQYAHAIILFQHKYGAALPPSIKVLVDQRFLRRAYKDPMTNGPFEPIYQTTPRAAQPGTVPGIAPGETTPPGEATQPGQTPLPGQTTPNPPGGMTSQLGGISAGVHGGLIGVVSRSKAQSIRIYNGYNHYNQWTFIYTQFERKGVQTPGRAPGTARPGQTMPTRPGMPQVPHPTMPTVPGMPGGGTGN